MLCTVVWSVESETVDLVSLNSTNTELKHFGCWLVAVAQSACAFSKLSWVQLQVAMKYF